MIRVFIVESHQFVRDAVRAIVEQEPDILIVGESADSGAALPLAARHSFDVLIADPGLHSFDAIGRIISVFRGVNADLAVIVLSIHSEREFQERAIAAGADAYVVSDCSDAELAPAIRAAARMHRPAAMFTRDVEE